MPAPAGEMTPRPVMKTRAAPWSILAAPWLTRGPPSMLSVLSALSVVSVVSVVSAYRRVTVTAAWRPSGAWQARTARSVGASACTRSRKARVAKALLCSAKAMRAAPSPSPRPSPSASVLRAAVLRDGAQEARPRCVGGAERELRGEVGAAVQERVDDTVPARHVGRVEPGVGDGLRPVDVADEEAADVGASALQGGQGLPQGEDRREDARVDGHVAARRADAQVHERRRRARRGVGEVLGGQQLPLLRGVALEPGQGGRVAVLGADHDGVVGARRAVRARPGGVRGPEREVQAGPGERVAELVAGGADHLVQVGRQALVLVRAVRRARAHSATGPRENSNNATLQGGASEGRVRAGQPATCSLTCRWRSPTVTRSREKSSPSSMSRTALHLDDDVYQLERIDVQVRLEVLLGRDLERIREFGNLPQHRSNSTVDNAVRHYSPINSKTDA